MVLNTQREKEGGRRRQEQTKDEGFITSNDEQDEPAERNHVRRTQAKEEKKRLSPKKTEGERERETRPSRASQERNVDDRQANRERDLKRRP